jgi:hypothetical protein
MGDLSAVQVNMCLRDRCHYTQSQQPTGTFLDSDDTGDLESAQVRRSVHAAE